MKKVFEIVENIFVCLLFSLLCTSLIIGSIHFLICILFLAWLPLTVITLKIGLLTWLIIFICIYARIKD